MADINSIGATSNTAANTGLNPNAVLGKDDFLKLLITQLQYQDPTAPMESAEILTQSSQLAALETQQATNKALEQLTASFAQTKDFSAVASIGKTARLENKVTLQEDQNGDVSPVNIELGFAEDIQSGTISIYDENNFFIKSIDIEKNDLGNHSFTWNGTDSTGNNAKGGDYTILAKYTNNDGVNLTADFPSYKIESVKFDNEKTYVKLNGNFIDFKYIQEIYE